MSGALSIARDFSVKMESKVGYSSHETWMAKDKFIELLVSTGELKEAKQEAKSLIDIREHYKVSDLEDVILKFK